MSQSKHIELKDGRKLFTKNNGFSFFVIDRKGNTQEVTGGYYQKALRNRITKRFKRQSK